MSFITPASRDIPAWFAQQLHDLDPRLVCYWNPFKHCYVVDRKAENGLTTNVFMGLSEEKETLPLNDNFLDRLRSMDAWAKFGSYEAFHRDRVNREVADQEKREAAIKAAYRDASADNKAQLNRAFDLTQRHDTLRINQ